VIEGTWFRPSQAEEYIVTDENDEVVPIPSGGLYWAVVPEGQPIDFGGCGRSRHFGPSGTRRSR